MVEKRYCATCSLTSEYPNIEFDSKGVCNFCNGSIIRKVFPRYRSAETNYKAFIKEPSGKGSYDCLLMLSGGKDSIYMLNFLRENRNKKILAFTMNSPYESKHALQNLERVFNTLCVDHITFTNNIRYRKLMEYVMKEAIENRRKDESLNAIGLAEKTPCVICSGYMQLMAARVAHSMNIPYIIYCADPYQIAGLEPDIKKKIGLIQNYIGLSNFHEVFEDQLNPFMEKDDAELPRIIFPYEPPFTLGTYDEEKIAGHVSGMDLYESSRIETHCTLFSLLNYQSFLNYGLSFYSFEISYLVRNGLIDREAAIQFEPELKDILWELARNEAISPGREKTLKTTLKHLFDTMKYGDTAIHYFYELLSSMTRTARELGLQLAH